MAVRRVGAKSASELESRVERDAFVVDFTTPPSLESASLAEVFSRLDSKLSAILSLMMPEKKGFMALSFRVMNLSAIGMRFHSSEAFDPGELLEMKLVLYGQPHVLLTIYGEVIRSMEQKQGFTISIRFVSETQEVRDAFLRYDFAEHRSYLRHIVEKGGRDVNLLLVNH
jgi:hypothetical protein